MRPTVSKTIVASLVACLFVWSSALACDSCQKEFRQDILNQKSASIHQKELLQLVNQSGWTEPGVMPALAQPAAEALQDTENKGVAKHKASLGEPVRPPKATS